jgi:hypothetical protein
VTPLTCRKASSTPQKQPAPKVAFAMVLTPFDINAFDARHTATGASCGRVQARASASNLQL